MGMIDWWSLLPFEYKNLRLLADSRPVGFRFSKYVVNVEADFQGMHLVVCGEANTQEFAATKAVAELLERTAMKSWLDQNPDLVIENSNGFAAHMNADLARENAIFERMERDAVLAQWYTATPFLQVAPNTLPEDLRAWVDVELSHSEFPILKVILTTMGLGPSVTCLLMNNDGFGVSGHSAKSGLREAMDGALAEACRAAHHYLRRSFWNDSLCLRGEVPSPRLVRPGAHALYYAYHEPFPTWMFGGEIDWCYSRSYWDDKILNFSKTAKSEFSFQVILEEPLTVGFAQSPRCFDLNWGPCNPATILQASANKRFAAPITERNLNQKPHIVA